MKRLSLTGLKKGTIMCAVAGAIAVSGAAGAAGVAEAGVSKPGINNIAVYDQEKYNEPNTNNTKFTFRNDKGTGYSDYRYKYNATKVYIYPTVGPKIYYRVFGANSKNGSGEASRSNHHIVPTGTEASFTNYVHENGNSYARLRYGRTVKAQYVDTVGWWSPDSRKTYTVYD